MNTTPDPMMMPGSQPVDDAVRISIKSFVHPNAERIEVLLIGGDADAREQLATVLKIALQGLLDDCARG